MIFSSFRPFFASPEAVTDAVDFMEDLCERTGSAWVKRGCYRFLDCVKSHAVRAVREEATETGDQAGGSSATAVADTPNPE